MCLKGDIRIEISNRRGEYISKLPGSQQKKLFVELKLTLHGMYRAMSFHSLHATFLT